MDINPKAVEMTKEKLKFSFAGIQECKYTGIQKKQSPVKEQSAVSSHQSPVKSGGGCAAGKGIDSSSGCALARNDHERERDCIVLLGDVRKLDWLADGSVDLILTHPPYLNIIRYSEGIAGDLSGISSVRKFCEAMEEAARELYRVLKGGRYCAILMGDTRRGRHFVPLAWRVMERFLKAGFVLKEDIIKLQHNCTCTGRWKAKAAKDKFYLIMHEHLFVFRKPAAGEDLGRVRDSSF